MTEMTVGPQILFLVSVFAAAFFWSPSVLASYLDGSGRPVYEIMRDFRIWQRRRVWIVAVTFVACLMLPLVFRTEEIYAVGFCLGLIALWGTDALQLHRIAQARRNVS